MKSSSDKENTIVAAVKAAAYLTAVYRARLRVYMSDDLAERFTALQGINIADILEDDALAERLAELETIEEASH